MENLHSEPLILFSLLSVWVLAGLFHYLGRFTRQAHFKTWTAGWLFYALFLTLSAAPAETISPALLAISKNWCIATGALLLLWGSFQFINVPARQRLIAMMVVFNLAWSCATADDFLDEGWKYFPAFAFLAVASAFTAFCFLTNRIRHARRGAALLSIAFSLWAIFLVCAPFLRGSGAVVYSGFVTASILQLLIATVMVVVVLEETRGKLRAAVDSFGKEVHRSSHFQGEAEAARESYQALFQNSRDAVAIVAEDNLEIIELNFAARKLLGIEKTPGGLPLQAFCSLPNQKQLEPVKFFAVLAKNPEVDLTLRDGAKVRASVRAHCLPYAGQKARQIIFVEVAERAKLGHQLRTAGGQMSALGQVISGVAHELNNPLAAIKGYTDLLLLTSQLDAQARSALMKVSLESNRAAKLVQDLVAFARPETPGLGPLTLNSPIQTFVESRLSELEAKGIAIDLDLSPESEVVLANAEQVQQVLAHLLNNAVEALEESDGQRLIRISTRTDASTVQVRVEDSGPGIDPNVLPRIFEPFFTTKPVGSGTGLGLSLCYSTLRHHKGKISHQPSALGGACFILEFPAALPVAEPQSKIATPEFRPANEAGHAAKLLVVDDEPSVVSLLQDMLGLLGHQVTALTSPYDAISAIETRDFDAILSDFRMPGINGAELFRRALAANPRYADRFIFLTADMMDPQTHEFFSSHKVRCMAKPFQLAALQSALAEILGGRKSEPSAVAV